MARPQPELNVALVGFGPWGQKIARCLHGLGALSHVCDSEAPARRLATDRYPEVGVVSEPRALFTEPGVHAVVIATPAVTHFSLARQGLSAGKDVWVEKPLAMTPGEGRQLVELARRGSRLLMVGHVLRYHPAVHAMQRLIDEGALGEVEYLYSNRLNLGRIRSEENILWSFAPHDISIMLALLEEMPKACSCVGAGYLDRGVADVTVSHLEFSGGVQAHIFVSWLHPFKEQRLVVVGTEGMAVFEDTASEKLLLFPHHVSWSGNVPTAIRARAERISCETSEPLLCECRHFLECLQTRRPPRTDGEEGVRVLSVLVKLQQSLEANGARVEVGARSG